MKCAGFYSAFLRGPSVYAAAPARARIVSVSTLSPRASLRANMAPPSRPLPTYAFSQARVFSSVSRLSFNLSLQITHLEGLPSTRSLIRISYNFINHLQSGKWFIKLYELSLLIKKLVFTNKTKLWQQYMELLPYLLLTCARAPSCEAHPSLPAKLRPTPSHPWALLAGLIFISSYDCLANSLKLTKLQISITLIN